MVPPAPRPTCSTSPGGKGAERRRRTLFVALAGLAVLATATLVLVTCRPAHRPPVVAPGPSTGIATRPGPFPAGPVAPPPSGALLGAWGKPAVFTQPARVAPVTPVA